MYDATMVFAQTGVKAGVGDEFVYVLFYCAEPIITDLPSADDVVRVEVALNVWSEIRRVALN